MNNYTSKDARLAADEYHINDAKDILEEIKEKSRQGKYKIEVNRYLDKDIIGVLKNLGYTIWDAPGIAIQKDNLYHEISW